MSSSLDQLTMRGFKSIRELKDFELKNLNILIGANGAGKSNLISFFRMLQSLMRGGLADYIRNNGGISGILYNGRQVTSQMDFEAIFNRGSYRFSIMPRPDEGADFELVNDVCTAEDGFDKPLRFGSSRDYSSGQIKDRQIEESSDILMYSKHADPVYIAVNSWAIYHFHNTGFDARMRHAEIVEDNKYLRDNASNIAPVLLRLRKEAPRSYKEILDACRLVTPFLEDFLLEPQRHGPETKVSLTWRTKGSDYPMQPYHLSDGSIRFICLATALLQPEPPSMIIVDEPELGLHPQAIDILCELIEHAASRTQVIVATQSVLLLNHFAIEDIVVVNRKDGQSIFERLEHGDFNVWLEEYSVGELWVKNVIRGS